MIAKFSERLYADLNRDLNEYVLGEDNPIKRLEKSVHSCVKYLIRLKEFCKEHDPSTPAEQIEFFKHIKPKFKSLLIFYQSLLSIETRKPIGEEQAICAFLANELKVLHHFFESNLSFYQYVRTEATYLDEHYFVRGSYDVRLDPDQCVIDSDPAFSTTHDHKLAQVLASELLQEQLQQDILRITQREAIVQTESEYRDFDWKQTKCALIELIYSWHATEAFGKKSLKSIVKFIERAFNVSLGNFYDTYDWLCGRQTPTAYLDEMKEAFLLRAQKRLR
ncbi:hypothetical protein EOD41_16795 [Mucilaginibacter limnophilus]|uniref:RteC protein n=1 Tax=Mucilaginibacter limnophilus TaxID=1932778 RepID=A0A3S2V6L1_9SPHI|nr:RteC domain-containing protein [Mucilaginibacter limnophilus]RVT98448.1 hypothetical protein EOD41_16795 [Mucilaginibacter limnophilus]